MKISEFLSENFHVLVVKFSVYLNRHVFIMVEFSPFPPRKKKIVTSRLL